MKKNVILDGSWLSSTADTAYPHLSATFTLEKVLLNFSSVEWYVLLPLSLHKFLVSFSFIVMSSLTLESNTRWGLRLSPSLGWMRSATPSPLILVFPLLKKTFLIFPITKYFLFSSILTWGLFFFFWRGEGCSMFLCHCGLSKSE